MSDRQHVTIDGNEAAAYVAHATNEVIAIYPITPASPMGELADAWSAEGRRNIFGTVPEVIEMQSEGGAAGAVHGALQAGALTTTFTASQGLLLMIPNMYKIAGELTPTVFHIAARTIATHALSIFGDHSDVMAVRGCGWAMLASSSVQEVHDFSLIAQAATLQSRVPLVHFFDGFRTSHEMNKIQLLTAQDMLAMIDERLVQLHRERALDPDRPVLRGSAQNPDVFFQAREAANPFYDATPQIVQQSMNRFAELVGRHYRLFDYVGAPDARFVLVMMGSGIGAAEEAIDELLERGEHVGLVKVRLFRPFDAQAFLAALPPTTQRIAVLDRTKEPGSVGEPLYQDVVTAVAEGVGQVSSLPIQEGRLQTCPTVIGGRYGLSSKEFTPAMAMAVLEELKAHSPKRHFTIGIHDDVTHLSLKWNEESLSESDDVARAVFYGLGSDGTVGATKNSVKIIGENTPLYAQGYFVYDSKKAGAVTVSHLRSSARPIRSTYLIRQADFVGCHQFQFLKQIDVLTVAKPGATFLLNSPYSAAEVWDKLPAEVQQQIIDKRLRFYVVDAYRVAREAGLGGRINTVMQTCFFALAGILPRQQAIDQIKEAIRQTYAKRGESVLRKNFAAVDAALDALHEVAIPDEAHVPGGATSMVRGYSAKNGPRADHTARRSHDGAASAAECAVRRSACSAVRGSPDPAPGATRVPDSAAPHRAELPASAVPPDFAERITAMIMAGKGDLLPVSALPVDGTFPTGTARLEKRSIAQEIPIWDPDLCIDCGLCALVCAHAAIRMKAFPPHALDGCPSGFPSKPWSAKDLPGHRMTIQVAPDDCTGCGVCVDVCPAKSKEVAGHKAINMSPKLEHLERERANFGFFLRIPEIDRRAVKSDTVKGSQLLEPLFEFSGACAGCGETPYLKLLTQLFGDRMLVANATGCSSIYGGNLPTTPWSRNSEGRGPAWSNSLFEDNAEFGLGIRLALDQKWGYAAYLLQELTSEVGEDLVQQILTAAQSNETQIAAQRQRVQHLKQRLVEIRNQRAGQLAAIADVFVRRSVWIVGGDGWAYDIGFGGLDHILASGRDVNVLVLDTAVYSNTGGQASKATPRAAMAKFAAAGKPVRKKDLGLFAMSYGNVYVAQVALGANPAQTIRVFQEAESYHGPSLIVAYSHCIAHGIEMSTSMSHQKEAVHCGFWPLYHYDPRLAHDHGHPLHLDSRKPSIPFHQFADHETRFAMLARTDPERAKHLFDLAQKDIDDQWHYYEQMAGLERDVVDNEPV